MHSWFTVYQILFSCFKTRSCSFAIIKRCRGICFRSNKRYSGLKIIRRFCLQGGITWPYFYSFLFNVLLTDCLWFCHKYVLFGKFQWKLYTHFSGECLHMFAFTFQCWLSINNSCAPRREITVKRQFLLSTFYITWP